MSWLSIRIGAVAEQKPGADHAADACQEVHHIVIDPGEPSNPHGFDTLCLRPLCQLTCDRILIERLYAGAQDTIHEASYKSCPADREKLRRVKPPDEPPCSRDNQAACKRRHK